MKKKRYGLILIFIVLLSAGFLFIGKPGIAINNRQLKKVFTAISDVEVITLDEVVPFEWDKVYTFTPYTSKEEIEKVIGFSSPAITETVNEGMVQLIFVKEDKIVASVCGYSGSLGYSVQFEGMITYGAGTKFEVEYKDDIICFYEQ